MCFLSRAFRLFLRPSAFGFNSLFCLPGFFPFFAFFLPSGFYLPFVFFLPFRKGADRKRL